MAKKTRKAETIAGVFALASIILLLVIVIFLGRHEAIFEKHYQIIGFFNSVGGLQPGAEVRLAGITVGYVADIEFGPQKRVKVKMSVKQNEQKRIRKDSIAIIETMGLMGDRYVEITVGSENEPMIPNGGIVHSKERFGLTELAEIAEPAAKDLEKIIHNLLVVTDKVVARSKEMGAIVDNVNDISTGLRQGKGTIGALLKDDAVYRKVSNILDTTRIIMEKFETVSSRAEKASVGLPALVKEARSSLKNFDKFSANADKAASDSLEIIHSGQAAVKDIRIAASNFKQLSETIKNLGPRLGLLLESAQSAVTEARELFRAAEHSWLLGGKAEQEHKENPISIEGRDIAEPQEAE